MTSLFRSRLLALAVLPALMACNHKELCFDHDSHAPRFATNVTIEHSLEWEQPYENRTDWALNWPGLGLAFGYDDLRPAIPEGIRMKAFNVGGTRIETNLSPAGQEIYLPPGENSLLFYNNDTEYIVFNDMGSYEEASATTRSRYRSSYSGNPYYAPARSGGEDEETVNAPDILSGYYTDSYVQNRDTRPQQLCVTMHPLVFTYVVRYRFEKGYEYVALARGALAGMARSVYLHNGRTSAKAVTVLFDCTLESWGIQAIVKSFGIPDFPNPSYSRGSNDFALTLEVKLRNSKILNFHFNITEQMSIHPHGGVITVDGIKISEYDGATGGSGFDVDVDDWGEFEDVTIDF